MSQEISVKENDKESPEDMLTIPQAAGVCGITSRQMGERVRNGLIDHYDYGHRTKKLKRGDVWEYKESCKRKGWTP